jgi:lipid II:glycine glycyltransferase (peptidoglycan interpeptide bridge formation enzyme)
VHLECGGRCSYLWGGRRGGGETANASEAIQWSAIRDARARGSRIYDLHGVPLDRGGAPQGGIALFKRGFGGDLVCLAGDLDLVLRPALYRAWRCGEGFYLRQKRGGGR